MTKGEKIATVTYTIDGKEVAQMPAYAGADIEKGTIFNNIWYGLKTFFSHLFSLKGLITVVVIVVILAIIYLIFEADALWRWLSSQRRLYTEESFSPQRQKTLVSIENHIKIKNTDSKAVSP